MKVVIVGPGIMPIPPTGWGAVEILIWDQKIALEKLGHEVLIVNTQSPVEILQQINNYRPDFVHVQYDDFVEMVPYIQYPLWISGTTKAMGLLWSESSREVCPDQTKRILSF